ncbi:MULTISPECIES: hypothetical protein [unclassified Mucilaginibacter]|uniref:hypothetical protein n=1 Tax=unclassified Mucilaginibacter TaxID=2617802 RepID=UPI003391A806
MAVSERMDAVGDGTYIGDRPDGKFFVQLYNLGSFYAEVFYDVENNEINSIRGFKSTKIIEPYLTHIKLNLR